MNGGQNEQARREGRKNEGKKKEGWKEEVYLLMNKRNKLNTVQSMKIQLHYPLGINFHHPFRN